MSTTELRIATNRANAQRSTGPSTTEGKALSCRNATRHGLLSARMFLDDEDPVEFSALCTELAQSLKPVDAIEAVLVERVAITLWRQRRLATAEAASLALMRQPRKIASGASSELRRGFGSELTEDELQPFDRGSERWARSALAEIEGLEEFTVAAIEQNAPHVWGQLKDDANPHSVEQFITEHEGGLDRFVLDLVRWCREQIRHAEARPQVLAIAAQVRARNLVLPADTLELFARYQSTLDNQLYKALRALRDAQEWRLKTLEQQVAETTQPASKGDPEQARPVA